MKDIGVKQQVVDEIKLLAAKNHVDQVILFGSRARGDYHRASDIDLAVMGGDIVNFSLDVEEKTSTLLTFDVIDLNKTLKTEFLNSIRKDGILIYEKV